VKIKIITDSTADLPADLARELGIQVVPAYLRIGETVYRDRVNFTDDEFYEKMLDNAIYPVTEPATPDDFAIAYKEAAREADGIISLHLSSKISATYHAALLGQKMAKVDCPIEVIDSESVSMGLGLLSVSAAGVAGSTKSFNAAVGEVKRMVPGLLMLGFFDSLKYLARGGRISRASAFFGSMLNIKPMLTMHNGEVEPAGHVNRRTTGIQRLYQFVSNTDEIQDVSLVYSTVPEEALEIADHIKTITSIKRVLLTKMGPILGAHGGPGALLVAVRTKT